ncbi:MAG: glycosyl transferase, partial [Candidatus Dadabacteria bacterium]|nr:glycosyl transferase [Candidatus Dadabacteria bacterium]
YGNLASTIFMPEWFLIAVILIFLSLLGLIWSPLLLFSPLAVISILAPIFLAFRNAKHSLKAIHLDSHNDKFRFIIVTSILNLLQPIYRLIGRMKSGLTPWRTTNSHIKIGVPWPTTVS